jgi:cell division transport system permease protein
MIYSLRLALKNLWHDKEINILATLTIGTCLFIFGLTLYSLYNVETTTKRLPERLSVTVFLSERIKPHQITLIERKLRKDPLIKEVQYISKEKALEELKRSMKDSAHLLEGLDENPLFPSLEIRLTKEGFDRKRVEGLIQWLKGIRGVEDVMYSEDILRSIHKIQTGFRIVSIGLLILISLAVIFICYSTVKILFFSRGSEIEIFKLLGATKGFIRTPFLTEGSAFGFIGGIIGSLGVYSVNSLIHSLTIADLPVFSRVQLPLEIVLLLPFAGLVLAIIGAKIAVGNIRY